MGCSVDFQDIVCLINLEVMTFKMRGKINFLKLNSNIFLLKLAYSFEPFLFSIIAY